MDRLTAFLGVLGMGLVAFALSAAPDYPDVSVGIYVLAALFLCVLVLKVADEREADREMLAAGADDETGGLGFHGAQVKLYDHECKRVVSGDFDAVIMFRKGGDEMDTLAAIDEDKLGSDTAKMILQVQAFMVNNGENLKRGDLRFLEALRAKA